MWKELSILFIIIAIAFIPLIFSSVFSTEAIIISSISIAIAFLCLVFHIIGKYNDIEQEELGKCTTRHRSEISSQDQYYDIKLRCIEANNIY